MSAATKWSNNKYVLLSELHDDHEIAFVENSLRDSEFYGACALDYLTGEELIGVCKGLAGTWDYEEGDKLITRDEALKLAGVEL